MSGVRRRRPGRVGGVARPARSRLIEFRRRPAVPEEPWVPEPPGTGWAMLACPHCSESRPLARAGRRLRCPAGHAFDLARQGYASLLSGRGRHGLTADGARMVGARAEVQGDGVYVPIRDGVIEAVTRVASSGLPPGGLLDVGGGTGYYANAVLDALAHLGEEDVAPATPPHGVTFDLSSYAARRAAKAHPGLVSVVADVRERFPILDHSVAVALVVFAPRNPVEMARVLAPGGVAVVVTPLPNHLAELGADMIAIDPHKQERLDRQFDGFDLVGEQEVEARVPVTARQAAAIIGMGPSAHHTSAEIAELADTAEAPWAAETRDITLAVRVATYRPAGDGPQMPSIG